MTSWLEHLSSLGIRFGIDDKGGLTTRAPKGTLTADLVDQIKAKKPDIIAWLQAGASLPALHHQPTPDNRLWPVTDNQQRLWLACQNQPDTTYTLPTAVILAETTGAGIDGKLLQQAIQSTLNQHRILRTRFVETQGRLLQSESLKSPQLRISGSVETPHIDNDSDIIPYAQTWLNQPMPADAEQLCRAELMALTGNRWLLLLQCHHLITDGWSNRLLMQEVLQRYQQLPADTAATDYLDYCQWLSLDAVKQAQQAELSALLKPITDAKHDLQPLQLTPQATNQPPLAQQCAISITPELTTAIDRQCQQAGCSRFAWLLSAWHCFLHELTGTAHFAVASPTANRQQAQYPQRQQIGFYVNTQLLAADFSETPNWQTLLRNNQARILTANTHADVPFTRVCDALGKHLNTADIERFFNAAINYEAGQTLAQNHIPLHDGTELKIEPLPAPAAGAKFPITLLISDDIDSEQVLTLQFDYDCSQFSATWIERLAGSFSYLLTQLQTLTVSSADLNALQLLRPQEAQALLGQQPEATDLLPLYQTLAQASPASYPCPAADERVETIIEQQTKATPNALAVSCDHYQFTYAELEANANRLAHAILNSLVDGDQLQPLHQEPPFIAIVAGRSSYLSVGLMAIIKAGYAYLPIDPSLSDAAISTLLDDAKPRLILANDSIQARLQPFTAVPMIDHCQPTLWPTAINKPDVQSPSPLFNVIYTSGSTGKPKGVMVPHRGIVNRLRWMQTQYSLTDADVVLQKTPYTFDVSVWELFWPLITGARLHFAADGEHQNSAALLNTVCSQGITTLHFVPSVFSDFLDVLANASDTETTLELSLKRIFTSGEALQPEHVEQHRLLLPATELHNLYGPTEASIDVSYFDTRHWQPEDGALPIGHAISHMQLLILRDDNSLCLPGMSGELCIAGVGLAEGYWQQPEITAKAFIAHQFQTAQPSTSQKLYRTGDLARYREDGTLEYLGRRDTQMKIRGVRVEADAIRYALLQYPGVDRAALITDGEGLNLNLTACLYSFASEMDSAGVDASGVGSAAVANNADQHSSIDTQALRQHLLQSLPAAVIPQRFVMMNEWPLTANGKLDQKRLRLLASNAATLIGPKSDTEKRMQAIWEAFLPAPIGCNQGFFELGGHSMLATRLIATVADTFERDIQLADLMDHDTVQTLSTFVDTQAPKRVFIRPAEDLKEGSTEDAPAPLSFQQRRLFLFWQLQPTSNAYNMPARFKLTGQWNIEALQQAFVKLEQRHTILRTRYALDDNGEPQSCVYPSRTRVLEVVETDDDATRYSAQQRILTQPFDLTTDAMLRASLIITGADTAELLVCVHHIACDALSFEIMLDEITQHLLHPSIEPKPLPLQYRDFAIWQQSTTGNDYPFWLNTLRGAPERLNLPLDHPRSSNITLDGNTISRAIASDLTQAIRRMCREHHCTPFTVMVSAWQVLLARLSEQNDICIGLPTSGRNHDVSGLIGFFVNSLILRTDLSDNPTTKTLLETQQQQLTTLYRQQNVAIEAVIEQLGYPRRPEYLPIAQVGFNYLQAGSTGIENALQQLPFTVEGINEPATVAKYEQTWTISETTEGFELHVEYQTHLWQQQTLEHWLDAYLHLLGEMLENPNFPVQGLTCEPHALTLQRLQHQQADIVDAYPLTPMQRDIWLDAQLRPGSHQNALGFYSASAVAVDPAIWQQQLTTLVEGADSLRAIFVTEDVPQQKFYQAIRSNALDLVNQCYRYQHLSHLDYSDQDVNARAQQLVYAPYLPGQPLWRAELLNYADGFSVFIMAGCHAMFDGVSLQMLGRLLKDNYQAVIEHQPTTLPANNYKPWLLAQHHDWDTADVHAFWKARRADLAQSLWHTQNASTQAQKPQLQTAHIALGTSTTELAGWTRRKRATPALYLKALYALAIKYLQGFDGDFLIEEAVSSRDAAHLTTQGLMFQQQPMVIDALSTGTARADSGIRETATFSALLKHMARWRKTGKAGQPLSLATKHRLLPQAQPFIFNFYVMETDTQFMGQAQHIEHLIPQQEGCLTVIVRQKGDELTLQATSPESGICPQQLLALIVRLHQAVFDDQNDQIASLPFAPHARSTADCLSTPSEYATHQILPEPEHVAVDQLTLNDPWGNPLAIDQLLQTQVVAAHDTQGQPLDILLTVEQPPNTQHKSQTYLLNTGARPNLCHEEDATSNGSNQPDNTQSNTPTTQLPAESQPQNSLERLLLTLWKDALGRDDIGVTDDFFALGGHSLLAMRIAHQLQSQYQIQLAAGQWFSHPTIRSIANQLIETPTFHADQLPPLIHQPNQQRAPLTAAQRRLWLFEKMAGSQAGTTIYNISAALNINGALDEKRLQQALIQIGHTHSVLNSRVIDNGDDAIMQYEQKAPLVLNIQHQPSRLSSTQQHEWQNQQLQANRRAFSHTHSDEPLSRFDLLKLDNQHYLLAVTLHHLIADAQSIAIIAEDLFNAYINDTALDAITHTSAAPTYADYAHWQQQWLHSNAMDTALAFWQSTLQGAPLQLGLPYQGLSPDFSDFTAETINIDFDAALTQQLNTLAQQQQISPFMLMLGMYQLTLSVCCQQPDVCVGIPLNGRNHPGLERVAGFFVNALVVRNTLDTNISVEQLLNSVRGHVSDAFAHQQVPAERVMQALGLQPSLGQLPIVQAAFSYLQQDTNLDALTDLISAKTGLMLSPANQQEDIARFECQLTLTQNTTALNGHLSYRKALFAPADMQHIADTFKVLCQWIVSEDALQTRWYTLRAEHQGSLTSATATVPNELPLTTVQQDLYLASLQRPNSLENSIGYALHLPVELNLEHFHRSLNALHQHYPMLRARLKNTGTRGEAVLAINDDFAPQLEIIDLTGPAQADTHADIQQWIHDTIKQPWNLQQNNQPLVKQRLIKLADNSWYTQLACHHILMDGLSFTLHAYHLVTNYLALQKGDAMQFADDKFVDYQRYHLQTFDHPESIHWWQHKLQNTEALQFAGVPQAVTIENHQTEHETHARLIHRECVVPDEHYSALKKYCRRQRITPALYFKCLYGLLINLYCRHNTDFVISEFHQGRRKQDMGSIGCHYHRALWHFSQSTLNDDLPTLFSSARQHQKETGKMAPLAIGTATRLLPANNLNFSYNYLFMPKSGEAEGISFDGISVSPEFDNNIDLRVQLDKGELVLALGYHPDLFDDLKFLERLLSLSEQITAGCETIAELDYYLAGETRRFDAAANDPQTLTVNQWIPQAIQKQIRQAPTATAVVCGDRQLSYADLDLQARKLANALLSAGAGRDQVVAIMLPRSSDAVVAILATLYTGACYLPIDPALPIERQQHMLAGLPVCAAVSSETVSSETLKQAISIASEVHSQKGPEWINIEIAQSATVTAISNETLNHRIANADDHFYAIYTSGSTGVPKAAYSSYGAASQLVDWYQQTFSFDASDRVLVYSSLGFDLTQKNLFVALTSGATLVLDDQQHLDPKHLLNLIHQHGVTRLNAAPSAFYPLADCMQAQSASTESTPAGSASTLQTVFLGGETIDITRLKPAFAVGIDLINMYGLTECTDISSWHRLTPSDDRPVLGKASAGNCLQLLTPLNQPVPPGIAGELVIRGSAVGRPASHPSHLGAENQTPERDQQPSENNHYQFVDGHWQYRTGDVVRAGISNGESSLFYLGRADQQMKFHGIRFHPAELENAIGQLPAIEQAHVLLNNDQLIACVTSAEPLNVPHLRQALASRIPHALLPTLWQRFDAFPLTRNGKVDRAALLLQIDTNPATAITAPRNATEQALAQIWREVIGIGVTNTDMHDDAATIADEDNGNSSNTMDIQTRFFDAGGNSLTALKLLHRIETQWQCSMPVARLFELQTIEEQARWLDGHHQTAAAETDNLIVFVNALPFTGLIYTPLMTQLQTTHTCINLEPAQPTSTSDQGNHYFDALINQYCEHLIEIRATDNPTDKTKSKITLVGHSVSGVCALALAKALETRGQPIAQVILLDAFTPSKTAARYLKNPQRLAKLLKSSLPATSDEALPMSTSNDAAEVIATASQGLLTPKQAQHLLNAAQQLADSLATQQWSELQQIAAPVTLLQASQRAGWQKWLAGNSHGWQKVLRKIDVQSIDADHWSIVSHADFLSYLAPIETHLER
ncbi:Tyrocidine synthase 3 [BD1-7 clade bacterium]|uniref:Tyrocidine synthase 3 n=1 Tax=BD1-7 clade bacterium TaxID=2029982 RepID=A0A5S9QVH9_9GAMM|nr:Tyrocidine synthase 3 [BD1-7 clade bacterium]